MLKGAAHHTEERVTCTKFEAKLKYTLKHTYTTAL